MPRTAVAILQDWHASLGVHRWQSLFDIDDEWLPYMMHLTGDEYKKMKVIQFIAYPNPDLHGIAEMRVLEDLARKLDSEELLTLM